MQLTKTHKILISLCIIAVLLGLYILLDRNSKKTPTLPTSELSTSTPTNASTTSFTTSSGVVINMPAGSNYKIEEVPANQSTPVPQPIPDLSRTVVFDANLHLDASIQTVITQKVSQLQTELKKQPGYLANWVSLGMYQKMAGDYQGAVVSWKYATRLSSSNYVAFGDLADLYGYYLHDNGQAEVYYTQALSKGPTQVYLYIQFASFARDVEGDKTKAAGIIDQGLVKIPNDSNLLKFKASLN